MRGSTVSGGFARALMDFAVSLGADRETLAARAGIAVEDLADQDSRIPMDRYKALMKAGQELSGEPSLALKFSEGTRFEELSIVGLICKAGETMGESLQQLSRYSRLVTEIDGLGVEQRFQLVRQGEELWLEDRRPDPNDFPELTEGAFSRFACEVTRSHGDVPFVTAVHVTHPRPSYSAEYDRIFKAPVAFDQPRNALRIEASWLAVKTHGPNRYVFGIFNEHAETLLQQLVSTRTTRGRVETLLIPLLHTGDLAMDAVAKRLGLSRQTLYRRLKAEGASFDAVLDDLRRRMALDYLGGRKLSVNETAYLVGFSDPSAFSRAFKRWTGASPRGRKGAPATTSGS